MASNSELSEIKLLLQSLAAGLKAVKSDVAELKKNQSHSQQNTSADIKSANVDSKLSTVAKTLSDTEASLLAKIRDTESAVRELIEEEKVLMHAEVVQLSRTVGSALEDAKAKMMGKVAEVVDANDRKRNTSTAGLDGDGDGDAAKKRVKQEEESDTDDSDLEQYFRRRKRRFTSHFDKAVQDLLDKFYDTFYSEDVVPTGLLQSFEQFYQNADDSRAAFWNDFQQNGTIGAEYCLYGIFYFGHKHPEVADGRCFCRVKVTPSIRQESTRCIRVERSEDRSGTLKFHSGHDIGSPFRIGPKRS